jgi:hypothetical protein
LVSRVPELEGSNMKIRNSLVLFAALTLAQACSTGQVGSEGQVRFSQVVSFEETTDFGPPIVTNAGMLVQLEEPSSSPEIVNPELTLVVQDANGTGPSSHAEVIPLGFAQFAITLTQSGSFTLVAEQGGAQVDFLGVSAAGAAGLRWHPQADVVVTGSSGSTACAATSQESVSNLLLSANTTITLHVIPEDSSNAALLGLLQLSATATGPVALSGGFLGQGLTPNSITVSPQGSLGAPATVTVSDAVTGKTLSVDIATQSANTAVSCQ